MFFIKATTSITNLLKNQTLIANITRNHWNKNYKPGPYPKTERERRAAAEKYNVCPSIYQPFPDDGFAGLGDYPKLPLESGDSKDPFYPWDNPELKRNFNEPLDANADMIGEDRIDVNARHRVPGWKQWIQTIVVFSGTFFVYYYCQRLKWFLAVAEKQYPACGIHYTFEHEEPRKIITDDVDDDTTLTTTKQKKCKRW